MSALHATPAVGQPRSLARLPVGNNFASNFLVNLNKAVLHYQSNHPDEPRYPLIWRRSVGSSFKLIPKDGFYGHEVTIAELRQPPADFLGIDNPDFLCEYMRESEVAAFAVKNLHDQLRQALDHGRSTQIRGGLSLSFDQDHNRLSVKIGRLTYGLEENTNIVELALVILELDKHLGQIAPTLERGLRAVHIRIPAGENRVVYNSPGELDIALPDLRRLSPDSYQEVVRDVVSTALQNEQPPQNSIFPGVPLN